MANKPKILIVEDEEDLRNIVIYNLNREGYETVGVESGEEGLEWAISQKPDLIILDLMLPGMSGMEVCRQIKQNSDTRNLPIIIVSAKGEESDIVSGLELGADDYLTKPFSPRILLARVGTVLRRTEHKAPESDVNGGPTLIDIDGLIIDSKKYLLKIDDESVNLTKSEFDILYFLVSRRGWVFTRYQIVDAIRGDKYVVTERSIDVQIAGLRKKLRAYADLIETVRGVGYRFKE